MSVPYTFQTATGSIPLSQLDTNFATGITIGNTSVLLGDTITSINNLSLANVTISSVASAFPNNYLANSNVIVGTTTLTLGTTVSSINGLTLSNVTISSGNVTISNVTTTNVSATTANISGTANVSNLVVIGNETVGGNTTVTGNVSMNVATITTANVSGTSNVSTLVVIGNASVGGNTSVTGNTTVTGAVGIGTTSLTGFSLRVGKTITGAVTSYGVRSDGVVQPSVTTSAYYFQTAHQTASNSGTPYTVGAIRGYGVSQGTFNADSTVTTQVGFEVSSTLSGATNNYGFYGNLASATGVYNLYMNGTASNYMAGSLGIGTSSPTAVLMLKAGTATASTAPLKFTSGTNLTAVEAGVVEYDGTVVTSTSNTNFGRATVPLTNYASGTGTALGTNTEATNAVLLPSANDTITLSIGTYFLDMSFIITRGATSTTSATARLNIRGTGGAVGTFSGMSLSAPTAGGATANFAFDAVNITTDNVLTAASTTAAGVYTMNVQGILKVTTAGTIIPQYSLSANINAAGTVAKVLYLRLQQVDSQSAAAAGPAGTGWA